jgi:hypothetical protein
MESCVYRRVNNVYNIRVLGAKNNLIKICLIVYLQMHCESPNSLKMTIYFFSSKDNSIRVATFLSVVSSNFALFYLCHEVVAGGAGKKCGSLYQHNRFSGSRIEVGTSRILILCDNYCAATIVNNIV